ncbi:MAG: hypothetical protein M3Z03_17495 [Actinomycetota bacterium]|nr:hypothetical protein [Actinomycetota bacterium]
MALLVTAAVLGVSTSWTSGQEAPPDQPTGEVPEAPTLPPAPPGLSAELSGIYASAYQVLGNATALASSPPAGSEAESEAEPPASPAEFNDQVAALTPQELDQTYAAIVEVPGWADVAPTMARLAEETSQTSRLADAMAEATGTGGDAPLGVVQAGPVALAASSDDIEPPPGPFLPSAPVAPGETVPCPPPPPGANLGHDAVFSATVAAIAVKTVLDLIPEEITIPPIELPNPAKFVTSVLAELLELAQEALSYLQVIYHYCEVNNQYELNFNTENTLLVLWELLQRTERTLANSNDGVIVVSEQLQGVQAASDEVLLADLHAALAADGDGVPDVAYQLPASEGGYLDAEPIGVKSVVTQSLASAQRVGLPVNGAAPNLLALADDALEAGRHADAFRLYQACYQELGR